NSREPGGETIPHVNDVEQQRSQDRAGLLAEAGPCFLQLPVQCCITRLQCLEHGAELVERVLDDARLGAHLVAGGGDLREYREQVPRLVVRWIARDLSRHWARVRGLSDGGFRRVRRVEPVQIGAQPVEQGFLEGLVHSLLPPITCRRCARPLAIAPSPARRPRPEAPSAEPAKRGSVAAPRASAGWPSRAGSARCCAERAASLRAAGARFA